jgi:hypothetical protein
MPRSIIVIHFLEGIVLLKGFIKKTSKLDEKYAVHVQITESLM